MKVDVQGLEMDTDQIMDRVVNNISNRFYREFSEEITKRVKSELDNRVNEMFDDLFNMVVTPTNSMGMPTGKPITIGDKLQQDMKTWFTQTVDKFGCSAAYGQTRLEYLFDGVLRDKNRNTSLNKAIRDTIIESVPDFDEFVKEKARLALKEALTKL